MSVRDVNYGKRGSGASYALAKAMADTRRVVEQQPAGAAFTRIEPVAQWRCGCGGINVNGRWECKFCGEVRK